MLRMDGAWRITVIGKDAAFDQRVVVRTPYGAAVLPGRVGASLDVPAQEWELHLEHHAPGLGWRPNVRVLPGPLQESDGGLRTRVVRSKDVDWAGGDPTERNFTLRLVRLEAAAPQERPVQAPIPAATPVARTSSDPYPDTRALAGTDRRGYRTGGWTEQGGDERPFEQGGVGATPAGRERGRPAHAEAAATAESPARWENVPPAPPRHERGPAATAGRSAGRVPADPAPDAVADDRWAWLPPVPEGWERVPVPLSELGPGEVPAIRPKTGQQRSLGQVATRGVPARWRAERAEPVQPETVRDVPAERWAAGGGPGAGGGLRDVRPAREAVRPVPAERAVPVEREVPAVWNTGPESPVGPDSTRAGSAGHRAVRGVPVEREVPAVWNTGPESPADQGLSRAGSAGHRAVRGVPVGGQEWETPAARRTVQGGPAGHEASRAVPVGHEAVRAVPVTGQAATGAEAPAAREAARGEAPVDRTSPARPW
ncbi:hypothetical protein [Kitasatospora sp. NPDC059327]|uniref:hypothetical protein n=1 Tax=Kitasatospora sp. NPDC059327 TaxID=3346803 RepID=UPI003675BC86